VVAVVVVLTGVLEESLALAAQVAVVQAAEQAQQAQSIQVAVVAVVLAHHKATLV
jgi:hypothetical protein